MVGGLDRTRVAGYLAEIFFHLVADRSKDREIGMGTGSYPQRHTSGD